MKTRPITSRGYKYWVVDYTTGKPGDKKRHRRTFKTQGEAKRFMRQKAAELSDHGEHWERFGAAERAEMAQSYDKAAQFGCTLNEAVMAYAKANSLLSSHVTVGEAVGQFLASRETKNLRHTTLKRYAGQLAHFKEDRADKKLADVSHGEIDAFLQEHGWETWTIITHLRTIGTFFAWAIKRELIHRNPAAAIEPPIVDDAPPAILTVAETRKLMKSTVALAPDFVPFIAIGLFAGARTSEIRRLSWKDIDLDRQLIWVQGKTRQRRVVEMSDNLKGWLEMGGDLPPARYKWKWQRVITASGWKPGEWPRNAMRHSCASYMLAANQNADKTALQLGHTPQMLFQHYRELVTPDQAREYWEIRP